MAVLPTSFIPQTGDQDVNFIRATFNGLPAKLYSNSTLASEIVPGTAFSLTTYYVGVEYVAGTYSAPKREGVLSVVVEVLPTIEVTRTVSCKPGSTGTLVATATDDDVQSFNAAQITVTVDPTNVLVGSPGWFVPFSSTVPADFAALEALTITPDPDDAWTVEGQSIILGDDSEAYWDGAEWVATAVPAP